ncbi:MAG: hypothetical protein K0R43_1082 [Pseudoduganella sp.]|jgi:hypothetical protein|nr:hypothetical protein [Pseudoduganella sp.]
MNDYIARQQPSRHAWLGTIVLLHAAVLLCWRGTAYTPAPQARRASDVLFLQAPRAQPAPLPAAAPAPRTRRAAPPPASRQAQAPAATVSAPPVAEAVTVPATEAAPDPFAPPVKLPATARERARHLAAGVDRQLRKESLNKFATIVESDTKLGKAIARAQNKEWVLEQTSDMGDGVTMKRFRKGDKEYCEYTNLVGARGQDPFRDGNKTKVMTCP